MHKQGSEPGQARLVLVHGIKKQIGELDKEIELLKRQRDETVAAQEALERIEAALLRMSILAREAAASEERRSGLAEEFESCKRNVIELLGQAEPCGFYPELAVTVPLTGPRD